MEGNPRQVRVVLTGSADRSYDVVIDAIDGLPRFLRARGFRGGPCILVTDRNVARHHAAAIDRMLESERWNVHRIVIDPGEGSKSFGSYGDVLEQALSRPIDRRTPVLALGGGVVGDLAGFVAATLLRGLPLVQIPTSLVAQVDSAIGGKTGINYTTGKNLIGAFHQPVLVLVDVSLMDTLPQNEWVDGLSEVVKYGLIADADLARRLLERWDAVLSREPREVLDVVQRCVEIKAGVVSEDETEQGVRAILNFGHTFGHAVERVTGYREVTHGQAVALGMRAALHLSRLLYPDVGFDLGFKLVHSLPAIRTDAKIDDLMEAMSSDKKRVGDKLRFVVLREIGKAVVHDQVPEHMLLDAWDYALTGQLDGC